MKTPNAKRRLFPRATELAHRLIAERLAAGARAIDATAGNGHDTLFLARRVGAGGEVFAFDVQTDAIEATRARLETAGLAERVQLFQECHSRLNEVVEDGVAAVMFNLGYLPGGDKKRITRPETTLAALEAALELLAPGGRLTVVVYPGHPGGDTEADAVEAWAAALKQRAFSVARYEFFHRANSPPLLIVVERK